VLSLGSVRPQASVFVVGLCSIVFMGYLSLSVDAVQVIFGARDGLLIARWREINETATGSFAVLTLLLCLHFAALLVCAGRLT